MKVIGVHLDRCTACKTCELYCAAERGSNGKTLLRAVQESPTRTLGLGVGNSCTAFKRVLRLLPLSAAQYNSQVLQAVQRSK